MTDLREARERLESFAERIKPDRIGKDAKAVLAALEAAERDRDKARAAFNCHSSPCRYTGPEQTKCAIHYIAEQDDESDAAEARLERAVALLRRLEWSDVSRQDDPLPPSCPVCGYLEDDGHEPGCELAALIG